MPRIDLNVPFHEKDAAKSLGARWDWQKKVWYVPDGVAAAPFERWLPKEAEINIRASRYYIVEAWERCWKCAQPTRVYGIALPDDWELYNPVPPDDAGFVTDGQVDEAGYLDWLNSLETRGWDRLRHPYLIYYIKYLPDSVARRMRKISSQYFLDYSQTTESSYWMNHCESCNAKQGDFPLYCEPEGAFFPLDEYGAESITLYPIDEPLRCAGSLQYAIGVFDFIRAASEKTAQMTPPSSVPQPVQQHSEAQAGLLAKLKLLLRRWAIRLR